MELDVSISEQQLLERARHVLRKAHSYGTPKSPTTAGFLALARLGKEVWNTWRKHYPEAPPDFSGVTFNEKANFSGYVFSTRDREIGETIDFSGAKFLKEANFQDAEFGDTADFTETKFDGQANFSSCIFEGGCSFDRTTFTRSADFKNTKFGESASFEKAKFLGSANFRNCTFGFGASFFRTQFGWRTIFSSTRFEGISIFVSAAFGGALDFRMSEFIGPCDFSIETKEDISEEAKQFHKTDFGGCIFHSNAIFTGRQLKASVNFGYLSLTEHEQIHFPNVKSSTQRSEFHGIPYFHQCKFHQDTSFDGAIFKPVTGLQAARAYRTLKLAMEQLKATREEQKFFRLEMQAEHPELHSSRRWISTLYSLTSDYGFSLWRPVIALLVFSLLFGTGYGLLANSCASDPECRQAAITMKATSSEDRTSDLFKYTLASVAPVPGLDKMQTELRAPLFGQHGWIAVTAIVLEIFHKILALVMTFLFALALRNLFKMKS